MSPLISHLARALAMLVVSGLAAAAIADGHRERHDPAGRNIGSGASQQAESSAPAPAPPPACQHRIRPHEVCRSGQAWKKKCPGESAWTFRQCL